MRSTGEDKVKRTSPVRLRCARCGKNDETDPGFEIDCRTPSKCVLIIEKVTNDRT